MKLARISENSFVIFFADGYMSSQFPPLVLQSKKCFLQFGNIRMIVIACSGLECVVVFVLWCVYNEKMPAMQKARKLKSLKTSCFTSVPTACSNCYLHLQ